MGDWLGVGVGVTAGVAVLVGVDVGVALGVGVVGLAVGVALGMGVVGLAVGVSVGWIELGVGELVPSTVGASVGSECLGVGVSVGFEAMGKRASFGVSAGTAAPSEKGDEQRHTAAFPDISISGRINQMRMLGLELLIAGLRSLRGTVDSAWTKFELRLI